MTLPILTDLEAIKRRLSRARGFEEPVLSERMRASVERIFGRPMNADEVVTHILEQVRTRGDDGVRDLTARIDGAVPDHLMVEPQEMERAYGDLDSVLREAMETAAQQIERFHRSQLRASWFDTSDEGILGQLVRPLERVGVYAPGGTAAYPSSLLMTAIPARVAGVQEVIVCSPPHQGQVSSLILAAAHIARVDRLFAIGGAQAIAAMAYGTESVPHVDKIYGPGNIFVVVAKQRLYGVTAIDALPGPTETLLVADESADARLVAADLLAQAEHDAMATAILLTTSAELAKAVAAEVDRQLTTLDRSEIAAASLAANGLIGVVATLEEAVALSNSYAPEHLCLLTENPWELIPLVQHAGGVFLGEDSPEALGDYVTGPSHVMPTGGTARFFSPVHVNDFVKVINLAGANRLALERLGPAAIALAKAEGLTAHARAVEMRLG